MKLWEIFVITWCGIGLIFTAALRLLEDKVNKVLRKLHQVPYPSMRWWQHVGATLICIVVWPLGLAMGFYPMTKELRQYKRELKTRNTSRRSVGK